MFFVLASYLKTSHFTDLLNKKLRLKLNTKFLFSYENVYENMIGNPPVSKKWTEDI